MTNVSNSPYRAKRMVVASALAVCALTFGTMIAAHGPWPSPPGDDGNIMMAHGPWPSPPGDDGNIVSGHGPWPSPPGDDGNLV